MVILWGFNMLTKAQDSAIALIASGNIYGTGHIEYNIKNVVYEWQPYRDVYYNDDCFVYWHIDIKWHREIDQTLRCKLAIRNFTTNVKSLI